MGTKDASLGQVKDLMSSDVVSLHSGGSVHEALQLMVENRVSALPIVDRENRCVGIISTTDLVQLTYDIDDDIVQADEMNASSQLRLVEKLSATVGQEPISSYMSEQVTTVNETQSLKAAARMMLKHQVHHLPVVNSADELVGILSTMDILAEFADLE